MTELKLKKFYVSRSIEVFATDHRHAGNIIDYQLKNLVKSGGDIKGFSEIDVEEADDEEDEESDEDSEDEDEDEDEEDVDDSSDEEELDDEGADESDEVDEDEE